MVAKIALYAALLMGADAQPQAELKKEPTAQTQAKTAVEHEVNYAPQAEKLDLHAIETAIIERTNQERARYGLPPLQVDGQLINSARGHAIWMTSAHRLQHTSAAVAENIAMGQTTADQVVNDWMRSPGHRANILNRSYRRIGAAAYRATNGTVFWCQQFLW